MAKLCEAGELRTKIYILAPSSETDGQGYDDTEYSSVIANGIYCKWVGSFGERLLAARKLGWSDPATLTMRYTSLLKRECRIRRDGDNDLYEIEGINDIDNRHVWLEVTVKRMVTA